MSNYFDLIHEHIKDNNGICSVTDDGLLIKHPWDICNNTPLIPTIVNQVINLENFKYLGIERCRRNEDDIERKTKTVGFFRPDGIFERVCYRPWRYVEVLQQYRQVLSPDFSCYTDMSITEQWVNTYLNRFIGRYWQLCGLILIPTITWSDGKSFDFCFNGVEKGAVVSVSTNGTRAFKKGFIMGFKELCRRIKPDCVICYGSPYREMHNEAKILSIEHECNLFRKQIRRQPMPGQLSLFDTAYTA